MIEPLDGAAYEEAYHFIQQTRMQQHQRQIRDNLPYSNRVDRTASTTWTGASCASRCARPSACKAAWP